MPAFVSKTVGYLGQQCRKISTPPFILSRYFYLVFMLMPEQLECRKDFKKTPDLIWIWWKKFNSSLLKQISYSWRNVLHFYRATAMLHATMFYSVWSIGRAPAHPPEEMRLISRTRQCRTVTQSSNQRLIGSRERHHVSELKLWHLEPTRKWTTLLRFMKTIQIENPIYPPYY